MQLSKKSRYGLRALIDLASAPQNQYVSLSNIAERGEIPAQFLKAFMKFESEPYPQEKHMSVTERFVASSRRFA